MKKEKGRSRKKKPFPVKAVAAALAAVLAAAAAAGGYYIYLSRQYQTVFFPNTVINGIPVSHKTVEEVKDMIASGIDGYVLTIEGRGGDKAQISGEEIGLHAEFDGSLEAYLAQQEPLEWWRYRGETEEYQISAMVVYEEERMQEALDGLVFFEESYGQAPADAYLSEYVPGEGYRVVPEQQGNLLNREAAEAGIRQAVTTLQTELSLEELDAYEKPAVTQEDEKLNALAQQLNTCVTAGFS